MKSIKECKILTFLIIYYFFVSINRKSLFNIFNLLKRELLFIYYTKALFFNQNLRFYIYTKNLCIFPHSTIDTFCFQIQRPDRSKFYKFNSIAMTDLRKWQGAEGGGGGGEGGGGGGGGGGGETILFSEIVLTQRKNPKSGNRPFGPFLQIHSRPRVSSLPFHNSCTNFSFVADLLQTRRTNGGSPSFGKDGGPIRPPGRGARPAFVEL